MRSASATAAAASAAALETSSSAHCQAEVISEAASAAKTKNDATRKQSLCS